jgi:hypothetical protein
MSDICIRIASHSVCQLRLNILPGHLLGLSFYLAGAGTPYPGLKARLAGNGVGASKGLTRNGQERS